MKLHNRMISALIATVLLCCLCACNTGNDTRKKTVAVITKSTDSDFWDSVRRGVNSAATEYNVSFTFDGPSNEEDYITQNEMIVAAVAAGVDAIVLSAIDYNKSGPAVTAAAAAGVKIVTIDSGVNSDKVSAFIGTDNVDAGRAAGAAVRDRAGDGMLHIGILNCSENTDNGQKRETGFRSYFENDANAEITAVNNVDSNINSATAGVYAMLNAHPEINVVVGFNEWMSLGIGNAVHSLGLGDSVCAVGFDSNVASIGMLETGEMDALIVQNPFAIGYLGVECAYNLVSGKPFEADSVTSVVAVTRDNMYDEENQKILFRFE